VWRRERTLPGLERLGRLPDGRCPIPHHDASVGVYGCSRSASRASSSPREALRSAPSGHVKSTGCKALPRADPLFQGRRCGVAVAGPALDAHHRRSESSHGNIAAFFLNRFDVGVSHWMDSVGAGAMSVGWFGELQHQRRGTEQRGATSKRAVVGAADGPPAGAPARRPDVVSNSAPPPASSDRGSITAKRTPQALRSWVSRSIVLDLVLDI
jgi:hypothetical protein